MRNINNMGERELRQHLHWIADMFNIGANARTGLTILTNVRNSANDEFCLHKRVLEFLEGQTFRLVKKSNGYIFTRPGHSPDATGGTIVEAVQRAIDYEDEEEA